MVIDMLILSSDDIVLITQNVLQTMLGFSAEPIGQPTPGDGQAPSDESKLITASIAIGGAWDGEVEVRAATELASQAASAMLATDPRDLCEDDICDVMAELTNMIGGNIKSQVLRPSQLSLPQVGVRDCPPAFRAGFIINNVPLTTVHGSLRIVVRHNPCV